MSDRKKKPLCFKRKKITNPYKLKIKTTIILRVVAVVGAGGDAEIRQKAQKTTRKTIFQLHKLQPRTSAVYFSDRFTPRTRQSSSLLQMSNIPFCKLSHAKV